MKKRREIDTFRMRIVQLLRRSCIVTVYLDEVGVTLRLSLVMRTYVDEVKPRALGDKGDGKSELL